MSEHILKVAPEYWESLVDGTKTFEVRMNDRGFQKDDHLILWKFPDDTMCDDFACQDHRSRRDIVEKYVSYVYSGDPRYKGIEYGFVVLGLSDA